MGPGRFWGRTKTANTTRMQAAGRPGRRKQHACDPPTYTDPTTSAGALTAIRAYWGRLGFACWLKRPDQVSPANSTRRRGRLADGSSGIGESSTRSTRGKPCKVGIRCGSVRSVHVAPGKRLVWMPQAHYREEAEGRSSCFRRWGLRVVSSDSDSDSSNTQTPAAAQAATTGRPAWVDAPRAAQPAVMRESCVMVSV